MNMKISELIERLGEIQGKHGDVNVWVGRKITTDCKVFLGSAPEININYSDNKSDACVLLSSKP